MHNSQTKLISLMLMLLVFTGQTLASTMQHCRMQMTPSSALNQSPDKQSPMKQSAMNHSAMEHSSTDNSSTEHSDMNHSANESSAAEGMSCCDISCDCPMGVCGAAFLLNGNLMLASLEISQQFEQPFYRVPTQQISNLYRPPILA